MTERPFMIIADMETANGHDETTVDDARAGRRYAPAFILENVERFSEMLMLRFLRYCLDCCRHSSMGCKAFISAMYTCHSVLAESAMRMTAPIVATARRCLVESGIADGIVRQVARRPH